MIHIHFTMQTRKFFLFTIAVVLLFTGCATTTYRNYLAGRDPDVIMEKAKMTNEEATSHICAIVMEESRIKFGEEGLSDIWKSSELKRCDINGFTVVDRGAINPHKKRALTMTTPEQYNFVSKYNRFNGQPSFSATKEVNYSNITHLKIQEYDGKPRLISAYINNEEVFYTWMSNKTLAALEILCPNLAGK